MIIKINNQVNVIDVDKINRILEEFSLKDNTVILLNICNEKERILYDNDNHQFLLYLKDDKLLLNNLLNYVYSIMSISNLDKNRKNELYNQLSKDLNIEGDFLSEKNLKINEILLELINIYKTKTLEELYYWISKLFKKNKKVIRKDDSMLFIALYTFILDKNDFLMTTKVCLYHYDFFKIHEGKEKDLAKASLERQISLRDHRRKKVPPTKYQIFRRLLLLIPLYIVITTGEKGFIWVVFLSIVGILYADYTLYLDYEKERISAYFLYWISYISIFASLYFSLGLGRPY